MFKDILITFQPPQAGVPILNGKSRLTGNIVSTSPAVTVDKAPSFLNMDDCYMVTTASGSRYAVIVIPLPQASRSPAYPTRWAGRSRGVEL